MKPCRAGSHGPSGKVKNATTVTTKITSLKTVPILMIAFPHAELGNVEQWTKSKYEDYESANGPPPISSTAVAFGRLSLTQSQPSSSRAGKKSSKKKKRERKKKPSSQETAANMEPVEDQSSTDQSKLLLRQSS
ncbi:hypothetical protein G7Y89_g4585 [Cudoniella acicularis]|uniref:Uncharacterized protein n=1 Tax=Cudoniella acicularis TaxID=354080 RepID=A0A8H4RRB7_9HELO|nr:hypothetical protein G7Y89_g4585 [Cudoniella acicularis]